MSNTASVNERAQARVGSTLRGKWRLERVIGVGGMATVYAATHRNQARVAIKVLHADVALDTDVTARFLREGYMANVVEHPGTAKVLDDDVTEDGAPFLVMELLEGETVDARWDRKQRRLPHAEAVAIVDQILDVLAAAHQKGVVHRDLKPENLFLTKAGELKILDFGIARLRELPSDPDTRTRAGALLGTPAFMAPEQARGRWDAVDAQTDLWAVGATLFTLLTGRFVHEERTIQEQLIATATRRAPSIRSFLPDLPAALVDVIDRALAYDKASRWPDARSMQLALRAAVGSEGRESALPLPAPSVPNGDQSAAPSPSERGETRRTLTTARPVTQGIPSAWVSKRRGGSAAYVALGMLLVVGGAALAWRIVPTTGPTSTQPPAAARATSEPERLPANPGLAAPPPEPETPAAVTAAPSSVPSSKPSSSSRPLVATKPKPDPTSKTTAAVESVPPKSTANPFDRRF